MIRFFTWAYDLDRPFWIPMTTTLLAGVTMVILVAICVLSVATGYWVVPVIVVILLPAYAVLSVYLRDAPK